MPLMALAFDGILPLVNRQTRLDSLGRRIGYNWWRDYNVTILSESETAWQALRESGQPILTSAVAGADENTGYYQLSEAEYRSIRPRPSLKEMLIGNAGMHTDHKQRS